MRRNLIAAVTVLSTVTLPFGQIASADDMPAKGAPAPVAAFDWTGFYVGGDVGFEWASGADMTFTDPNGVLGTKRVKVDDSLQGLIGLHSGYNWQFAPLWVLGTEGDFSFGQRSNTKGVGPNTINGALTPNTNVESTVQPQWLASLRGKLGFTGWWNTMFYLTGGGALAGVKFVGVEHNDPPTFAQVFRSTATSTDVRIGWVAGAGAEMPLNDHLLVRAEYLRYGFAGKSAQANLVPNPGAFPQAFAYNWSALNLNVVRLGLTYKF